MTATSEEQATEASAQPGRGGRRDDVLRQLPLMAGLVDVIVVNLTITLAVLGRASLPVFDEAADVSQSVGVVAPAIVVGWVLVLAATGAYRRNVFGAGTEEYRKVVNASLFLAGAVGVLSYLTKYQLSRGFFLLIVVIGVPALVLGRYALRKVVQSARQRGKLQQRVVIAGDPASIDELDGVFRREGWLGFHTVAALTPAEDVTLETASGIPVAGNVDDVAFAARQFEADIIVFASGSFRSGREVRQLVWALEDQDVQVVVTPSVTDVSSERVTMRPVAGLPMIHLERPRTIAATRSAKRAFDLVGATLILIGLVPVFAVAALRIRLDDGGPVLFRQVRVGRDGVPFRCFKFRTMVVDAEERLAALRAEVGHETGLFKLQDDPRITTPGRWLRRYSVDELPQLLNVLRGDMSLVGPRPPLPSEVATYEEAVQRRLRVRPGMTGLWQVSGRSDLSWDDAVRLDLYYVDNWSMVQDLVILLRTVGAVLRSRGAY